MPRKTQKGKRTYRRRLTAPMSKVSKVVGARPTFVNVASKVASAGYKAYRTYQRGKSRQVSDGRTQSLMVSDNISKLPITIIGKPKKPSFAEKVARVERPPIMFKRNYQFNAECGSGRKAWFNINLNHYSNDIHQDITQFKMNLTSDTLVADDTLTDAQIYDKTRFYIDYMNTKLQFMNSGTNALTGKIHLFAYKRDAKSQYASTVPINPVNLMMYYSTFGRPLNVTNQEAPVGSGWNFDTSTANNNYTANVNMPGSSINTTGVCAHTDLALSPLSTHVKDNIGFWFRRVFSQTFNLKPGQQVNKVIKFHDLPEIFREQLDLEFFAGISYALAVEFQGQVVGSTQGLGVGDGVISTGSAQLSVIREDIRILGQKNGLKSKVMLQTSPLDKIANANQIIINPDTGTQLSSYSQDI